MKLLTWNINGIRASKVELSSLFNSLDADVICLQETKVTRDMLDEPTAIVEGYNSYFSFSKKRSGYSGVATFCKSSATPTEAEEGLYKDLNPKVDGKVGHYGDVSEFSSDELEALDSEGRAVITKHKIRKRDGQESELAIINVYCPRVDPDREDRLLYKLRFFALLQTRAEALLKSGCHVIVLGDMNVKHKSIDMSEEDEIGTVTKPSRVWVNQFVWDGDRDSSIPAVENREEFAGTTSFVSGGLFVDSFRYLYPDKEGAFTNWCTLTSARETNYGRRLDYIFTDIQMAKSDLKDCIIMSEVEGSDHCPVKAEYFSEFIPSDRCPALCTKYMPEFCGKQVKLSSFFIKKEKTNEKVEVFCSQTTSTDTDTSVTTGDNGGKMSSKRTGADEKLGNQAKRRKTESSDIKQGSLKGFFLKTSSKKEIIDLNIQKSTSNTNEEIQTTEIGIKLVDDVTIKNNSASAWKSLLKGPPPPPLCKGHQEVCVLRTVKKPGPNKGKQFFVCARGEGHSSNPEARCDFFKWVDHKKK
ncbi:DNA-(apurinic or apyrimidinic site) endonuclease 2-like [Saccostrea cucullata]|uniref:DNA-(apurinic or apyrimidinic site) endonuclease 2-like n=1 Tax=Saccostrea cuccullata TaxID=36930 RepID=UPI002ED4373C